MAIAGAIPIIASAVGSFLGPLVTAAIEGAGNVIRIEIADAASWLRNLIAGALDSFIEAEPDSKTGVSASGLVNIVKDVLKATAYLSIILPGEIVEELLLELVQEGFSNAIQTSVGGAFQSILNVWRGGMPPNPDEMSDIVTVIDAMDLYTATLIFAMSGNNIPTSFVRAIMGWRRYVDQTVASLKPQLMEILKKWNEATAWLVELVKPIVDHEFMTAIQTYREILTKSLSIIDMVGERALARLQELLIECRTALEWLNMGVITPEEASLTARENLAEAKVTIETYRRLRDVALKTVDEITLSFDSLVNDINTLLTSYLTHLNDIITSSQIDFTNEFEKLKEALRRMIAYRMAVENKTKIIMPVEMAGAPVTPVIPGSVYVPTAMYTFEIVVY